MMRWALPWRLLWLAAYLATALHLRIPATRTEGLYLGLREKKDGTMVAVVCDGRLDVVHRCEAPPDSLWAALGSTARHVTRMRGPSALFPALARRRRYYGPETFFECAVDVDEAVGLGLVHGDAFIDFGEGDSVLQAGHPKVCYANGDVARRRYRGDFDSAVASAPPGNDGIIGIDVVVPESHPRAPAGSCFHAAVSSPREDFERIDLRAHALLLDDGADGDLEPRFARAHVETRLLSMRGALTQPCERIYVPPNTSRRRAQLVADVFGVPVASLPEDDVRDAIAIGRAYRAAAADAHASASLSEVLVASGRAAQARSLVLARTPRLDLHNDVYNDHLVQRVLAFERSIELEFADEASPWSSSSPSRDDASFVEERGGGDDSSEAAEQEDDSSGSIVFLPSSFSASSLVTDDDVDEGLLSSPSLYA